VWGLLEGWLVMASRGRAGEVALVDKDLYELISQGVFQYPADRSVSCPTHPLHSLATRSVFCAVACTMRPLWPPIQSSACAPAPRIGCGSVWQLALIRLGLPPLRNTFTRGGGRVATAIVRALATQVIVLSCTPYDKVQLACVCECMAASLMHAHQHTHTRD
jgi:hypothetical protein